MSIIYFYGILWVTVRSSVALLNNQRLVANNLVHHVAKHWICPEASGDEADFPHLGVHGAPGQSSVLVCLVQCAPLSSVSWFIHPMNTRVIGILEPAHDMGT